MREARKNATRTLFPDATTRDLYLFEVDAWRRGLQFVAGVDEAGRGPLAGPVVAACVVMYQGVPLLRVDDSKKLSAETREALWIEILNHTRAVGIGAADVAEIEEWNILQASLRAMGRAVLDLPLRPELVLVDGVHLIPGIETQRTLVRGDSRSGSIAAASIVAKVTRDRMMLELHDRYPQYNFASNKGYATREHLEALSEYGPCPVHRKAFKGVREHIKPVIPPLFFGL